jgi:hypothetical protein
MAIFMRCDSYYCRFFGRFSSQLLLYLWWWSSRRVPFPRMSGPIHDARSRLPLKAWIEREKVFRSDRKQSLLAQRYLFRFVRAVNGWIDAAIACCVMHKAGFFRSRISNMVDVIGDFRLWGATLHMRRMSFSCQCIGTGTHLFHLSCALIPVPSWARLIHPLSYCIFDHFPMIEFHLLRICLQLRYPDSVPYLWIICCTGTPSDEEPGGAPPAYTLCIVVYFRSRKPLLQTPGVYFG